MFFADFSIIFSKPAVLHAYGARNCVYDLTHGFEGLADDVLAGFLAGGHGRNCDAADGHDDAHAE